MKKILSILSRFPNFNWNLALVAFVSCVSFLVVSLNAQSITWQRVYDGPQHSYDGAYSICAADSSNIFIGGYSGIPTHAYILKINKYGDTLWTRWLVGVGHEIMSMVSSGDGGCVFTGYGGTVYAAKMNASGQIVWNKYYGAQNSYQIIKTKDGGYMGCGDVGTGGYNGYIFRTDQDGNLIWDSIYNNRVFYTLDTAFTGFIVGGYYHTGYGYLCNISDSGRIIWEKYFNSNVPNFVKIKQFKKGYICGGNKSDSATSQYARAFVLLTDSNGIELSFKEFSYSSDERFLDLYELNSNKSVILTNRDSAFANNSSRILIIDSTLSILKSKIIYDGRGDLLLRTVIQAPMTTMGELILAGSSTINFGTFEDVFAIRLDSSFSSYVPIAIVPHSKILPRDFQLFQNFPNPFNPVTILRFSVSERSRVALLVIDVLGKIVAKICNSEFLPGNYNIVFNGSNLSSGIYFYSLFVEDNLVTTKKMILFK